MRNLSDDDLKHYKKLVVEHLVSEYARDEQGYLTEKQLDEFDVPETEEQRENRKAGHAVKSDLRTASRWRFTRRPGLRKR